MYSFIYLLLSNAHLCGAARCAHLDLAHLQSDISAFCLFVCLFLTPYLLRLQTTARQQISHVCLKILEFFAFHCCVFNPERK